MSEFIESRIEWCRWKRTQTDAPLERAEWQAEEEGLCDALLNRDYTTQYQQGPAGVVERYMLGLQDGLAMLRTAAVYHQFTPSNRTATTGSCEGIDGRGDVSMRRILGLTKRARKYLQECRVTWQNTQ